MPDSPITAGERFADLGSFGQRGGDGPNLWRTLGFRRTHWEPGTSTVEWDATAGVRVRHADRPGDPGRPGHRHPRLRHGRGVLDGAQQRRGRS